MARSKTSQRWLKEHFDDPYVKMAQKDGYRSRASYKLLEIQEKDRILRPGYKLRDDFVRHDGVAVEGEASVRHAVGQHDAGVGEAGFL